MSKMQNIGCRVLLSVLFGGLPMVILNYLVSQLPILGWVNNLPTIVKFLGAVFFGTIVFWGPELLNVKETRPEELWRKLLQENQKLINDCLKNSLDQDTHIPIASIDSPGDLERPRRKAPQQSSANGWRKLWQNFQPAASLQKVIADKLPQLKSPWNLENLQTGEVTQLSPSEPIIEIFKEANRRLLILGEPGSGKTTELLKLAQALGEAAAENNSKEPIPLIFELSTWRGEPMFDWMVGEIVAQYVRKPNVCREWLKGDRIVPLLDGLDELGEERAKEAIRAIDDLQADYPHQQNALVICCRVKDYESLTDENNRRILLKEKGVKRAVRLCELADDQIKTYLEQRKAEHIWDELQSNSGLMELARNPMLLNLMPIAYPDELPDNLPQNPQECQSRLFDDFLHRKLSPRLAGYDPEKAKYYLVWLAASMGREDINQREFLIERLQPTWLETQKQRNQYSRLCRGMFGIIVGLISSMIGGLILGVISGLIGWLLYDDSYSIHLIEEFNISWKRLKRAIFLGLICSLIGGMVFGLMSSLIGGLIFGLIGVLIGSFIDGFIGGLIVGLVFGIRLGLIVGLIIGIIAGLKTNIKVIKHPKQVIIKTGLNAMIIMGLTIFLWVLSFIVVPWTTRPELIFNQFVISRVLFGAFFGYFLGGGEAFTKHFILREVLCHHGLIPRNYVQFLNEASARGILKKSGGRYRFYHDKFREHLAQLEVEPVSRRKPNKFFGWSLHRR